jgi:hypothetical protein
VIAPWTWRHTVDKMEITPDRSMEIKHVDEEPYHIMDLLTFDVIV